MRKILFILMMLTVSAVVEAQTPFRGVDFTTLHLSPVDSALLRMNSVMYSGWDTYGEVTSSKSTVYRKWANNPEKYYPVMKEAWKYCIDHAPYQVRLYKEGARFYQMMIQGVIEDSVKRMKYGKELMTLYDQRIHNLDSINAHVKRESDKSSKGNQLIYKAWDYENCVYGKQTDFSKERVAVMYPIYKEAIGVVRKTFDEGENNGGDVTIEGLKRFFNYAAFNYYNIYQDNFGTDSVSQQIRAAAKVVLLDEYNFLKDFCDRQIQEIGKDYVDTLSVEGSDSLDVVQEKVVAPYKSLMQFCDENMTAFKIKVSVQTLSQAVNLYDPEFDSHKTDRVWLERVIRDCENTIDFDPDNIYYSSYQDYLAAYEKLKDTPDPKTPGSTPKPKENEWYTKARPHYNKVVAFAQSGKANMDNATFNSGLYCIYCLNQAIRTDPGHAEKYQKLKSWVSKGVRTEAFYRNVRSGQSVTVNGVTFTATF